MANVLDSHDDPSAPRHLLNHPMKGRIRTLISRRMAIGIFGTFGILAAVAIFSLFRIRANSQNYAVMGNLRLLGSGADQYFLDTGKTSVRSAELIGTHSTQYFKWIATVAHESYNPILKQGEAITASGIAGTRTITYSN
jgi:type IV pilus assembly protein PilA